MNRDEEILVEAITSAFRERKPDGEIRWHSAWYDLDAANREIAFVRTLESRKLESAMDPQNLSSTARAVLARIIE